MLLWLSLWLLSTHTKDIFTCNSDIAVRCWSLKTLSRIVFLPSHVGVLLSCHVYGGNIKNLALFINVRLFG